MNNFMNFSTLSLKISVYIVRQRSFHKISRSFEVRLGFSGTTVFPFYFYFKTLKLIFVINVIDFSFKEIGVLGFWGIGRASCRERV